MFAFKSQIVDGKSIDCTQLKSFHSFTVLSSDPETIMWFGRVWRANTYPEWPLSTDKSSPS